MSFKTIVDKWLKPFDVNNDGKLDEAEFLAVLESIFPGVPEKENKSFFKDLLRDNKKYFSDESESITLENLGKFTNILENPNSKKDINKEMFDEL